MNIRQRYRLSDIALAIQKVRDNWERLTLSEDPIYEVAKLNLMCQSDAQIVLTIVKSEKLTTA